MAGDKDRVEGGGHEQDWDSGEGQPLETNQLELAEADSRLPWLESADDGFEEDEDSGTGRLIGLMAIGLVVLAAIVGGIWWATHRSPDPALVAEDVRLGRYSAEDAARLWPGSRQG